MTAGHARQHKDRFTMIIAQESREIEGHFMLMVTDMLLVEDLAAEIQRRTILSHRYRTVLMQKNRDDRCLFVFCFFEGVHMMIILEIYFKLIQHETVKKLLRI